MYVIRFQHNEKLIVCDAQLEIYIMIETRGYDFPIRQHATSHCFVIFSTLNHNHNSQKTKIGH